MALVLPAATWERNRAWRNGLTLFSDAIEKNPAEFYSEAIRINPGYLEAYQNRVVVRYWLRDFEGSMVDCGEIIGTAASRRSKSGDAPIRSGWPKRFRQRVNTAVERRTTRCSTGIYQVLPLTAFEGGD